MTSAKELNREQLEQLDKSELIEIILFMQQHIHMLEQQLAAQSTEVQKLKAQLAKDSRTSSKPPSSDGLQKKTRKSQSLRQKQGRTSGGQPGHQGRTLTQVTEPDHKEVHTVCTCAECAADLRDVAVEAVECRQVFDIPPVLIEVTEHQAEIKTCPQCGAQVKGQFPADVTQPVQYGNRIKAQASYLNIYQLLPWARACEMIGDFYGHQPAEALIQQANAAVQEHIAPSLVTISRYLLASPVVHFDESGLRVENALHWLHVASTAWFTYYTVHRKRGQDGMAAMGILPTFTGKAMHDCWSPYFSFENCQHVLCNAHHLRDLLFITEQYQQDWATQMSRLLLDIKAEVEASPPEATALPVDRLRYFEERYDETLLQGLAANPPPETPAPKQHGRKKQSPPKNLLDRLQARKAQVLAFMYDFRVPFDNNLAERDVRMVKIKQKVSGAFRTTSGAETFCAIRSYISTVRKHDRNVIDAIFDALSGRPFIPSLSPQTT